MPSVYFLIRAVLSVVLFYASFVSVYVCFIKHQSFDFLTVFWILTLVALAVLSLCDVLYLCKFVTIAPSARKKYKKSKESFLLERISSVTAFIKREKILKIFHLKSFSNSLGSGVFQNKGLLAVCLVSLSVGAFNCASQYPRGIGQTGEFAQFSLAKFSGNIVKASYLQQQPPLDYQFSAFAGYLFPGNNKLAMRWHAMLFYLALCLILPLGLWFFCSSLWITTMGAGLFLLNHTARLHAVDGRPLSLSLLTSFLFLFFWLSYCNKREGGDKPSFFPVISSQYLFVMSIGLQPVIFIVSLFLSSFWLFLYGRGRIWLKLFLSNIITAVLSLPFYLKMTGYAQEASKFHKISFESLSSYISNLNIQWFFEKYFSIFYKQMSLFFLLVVIGFIVAAFIKKSVKKESLILASCLFVFPVVFDPLWNLFIMWHFNDWYIMVFSLFLVFFAVFVLGWIRDCLYNEVGIGYEKMAGFQKFHLEKSKQAEQRFSILKKRFLHCVFLRDFQKEGISQIGDKENKSVKNILRVFTLGLVFISFLLGVFFQISAIKNETRFKLPYQDNSVEKVYNYLKENGDPQDKILDFCLCQIVDYRIQHIWEGEIFFYDPKSHPAFIHSYIEFTQSPPFFYEDKGDRNYYIDWSRVSQIIDQKVFFVVEREVCEDTGYTVLSSFMEGQRIGEFVIFMLNFVGSPNDKKQQYLNFLSQVITKTPKSHQGILLETLIYYAYKDGKKQEFDRLLREYRDIGPSLDTNFMYPRRFELKRRVRYFENLKWPAL